MSRAQQGAVDTTAAGENSTYNTNATDAFKTAQGDIGSFADEVGAFKASNPYVQGGAVQTADNQQTADTAAGLAQSAGQGIQAAAVRTGQNAAGDIAATQDMQQQNERNLVGQEAGQTAKTAASNAGFQSEVVGDVAKTQAMQDQLAQQQGQLAQGALGTEEEAARQPSFLDELGSSFATSLGSTAGKGTGCWVAAEIFGGWDDARTVVVRDWIFGDFRERWYGKVPAWLYLRFGERLAAQIRERGWLRAIVTPVFEAALKAAKNGR